MVKDDATRKRPHGDNDKIVDRLFLHSWCILGGIAVMVLPTAMLVPRPSIYWLFGAAIGVAGGYLFGRWLSNKHDNGSIKSE